MVAGFSRSDDVSCSAVQRFGRLVYFRFNKFSFIFNEL